MRSHNSIQEPLITSKLYIALKNKKITKEFLSTLSIDEILEEVNLSSDVNSPPQLMTSLQAAVLKGEFEEVKMMVDRLANLVSQYEPVGSSSNEVQTAIDKTYLSFVDAIEFAICKCCSNITELEELEYHKIIKFIIEKIPKDKITSLLCTPHPLTCLNRATSDKNLTSLDFIVRNGKMSLAKIFIENNINPNPLTSEPLVSAACVQNNSELALYLIEHGADVNPNIHSKISPLSFAVQEGFLDVVKALILKGADVNQINNYPLLIACNLGHLDIVTSLLNANADPNYHNEEGHILVETALTNAIKNGHLEIVELLLSRGARVNIYIQDGNTPLTLACNHLPEAVALLIKHGADVNSKTHSGLAPLNIVCSRGYVEAAKVLLENNADINYPDFPGYVTPLQQAAFNGHVEVVKLLLSTGKADINFQDKMGMTALTVAILRSLPNCESGHGTSQDYLKIAEALIAYKADYLRADFRGLTPMHYACAYDRIEILELLLKLNEKKPLMLNYLINSISHEGETPLQYAITHISIAAVEFLLRNPNFFCENKNGQYILRLCANGETPLHTALILLGIAPHCLPMVRSFLFACNNHKVNINVKDKDGNTPLHLAVDRNIEKVLIGLFLLGINIDDVNAKNETALYIAYKNGFDGIAKLLVSKNASLEKTLKIAFVKCNLDIIEKIANQDITPLLAQEILIYLSSNFVNKNSRSQRNRIVEQLFIKISVTNLHTLSVLVNSLESKNTSYFNLILNKVYTSPKNVDPLDRDILISTAKALGLEREVKLSLQIKDEPSATQNKNILFQFPSNTSSSGIARHAYLKQQGLTKGEIKELDEERKEKYKAIKSDKQEVVEDSLIAIEPIPAPTSRLVWGDEAGSLDSDMPDVCKVLGAHENVRFYSHPSLITDEFVDSFKIDPTKIATGGPVADAGIKPIDFLGFLNLKIGGKPYPNCKVEYEYKVLNSEARLLLATVKEGSATLYVAYKFLPKGLHTVGAVRAEKMSIRMSGVVEVKLPTREPTLMIGK